MTTSLISLKPSCQNRLLSQGYPSASQSIFTIQDFSSPNFLESYIFASKNDVIDQLIHISTSSLIDLIDKVNRACSELKRQIDTLQDRLITKFASLPSPEQGELEEIHYLECMMRKLHQKIVQNNFDATLLDEFTRLRRKYDQLKEKVGQSHRSQANVPGAIKVIDSIVKTLTESIDRQLSRVMPLYLPPIQDLDLDMTKTYENYRCKTKLVSNNEYKHEEVSKGTIVNLRDKDYFVFAEYMNENTPTTNSGNGILRLIDLKNGKLLSSSQTNKAASGPSAHQPTKEKVLPELRYVESLNLVFALTINKGILNIYRIFHNKTKKIRTIQLCDIDTEDENAIDVSDFEILEPQNIVALFGPKRIYLINILTGQAHKNFKFTLPILGVRYIQDLKVVVVTARSKFDVYDVSSEIRLSKPKFFYVASRDISELVRIYYSGNMILMIDYGDHFKTTFFLYQINPEGIKQYKFNSKDIKSIREQVFLSWNNCAISINPKSKTIEYIFGQNHKNNSRSTKSKNKRLKLSIRFEGMLDGEKGEGVFRKFGKGEEDIRENIRLEGNNSLVYYQRNLYMNKYYTEDNQEGEMDDDEEEVSEGEMDDDEEEGSEEEIDDDEDEKSEGEMDDDGEEESENENEE